jgi:hypothetical protein
LLFTAKQAIRVNAISLALMVRGPKPPFSKAPSLGAFGVLGKKKEKEIPFSFRSNEEQHEHEAAKAKAAAGAGLL